MLCFKGETDLLVVIGILFGEEKVVRDAVRGSRLAGGKMRGMDLWHFFRGGNWMEGVVEGEEGLFG